MQEIMKIIQILKQIYWIKKIQRCNVYSWAIRQLFKREFYLFISLFLANIFQFEQINKQSIFSKTLTLRIVIFENF